ACRWLPVRQEAMRCRLLSVRDAAMGGPLRREDPSGAEGASSSHGNATGCPACASARGHAGPGAARRLNLRFDKRENESSVAVAWGVGFLVLRPRQAAKLVSYRCVSAIASGFLARPSPGGPVTRLGRPSGTPRL